MRGPRFDQNCVTRPKTGEIEGISTTRIIHVDGAGFHEESPTTQGLSQRCMAAPFFQEIGLRLDDPCFKPAPVYPVPQDFTQ